LKDNVYIVIPAKDEAGRIGGVLHQILDNGYSNIVVVNDGSKDKTADVSKSFGVTVLDHLINLGAGAATQTGIEYAIARNAEIIVTIDADHQHMPYDIDRLVEALHKKQADIVIGSRFLNKDNCIPSTRILYNKIANIITYLVTGILVTDSQSGMKAFTARFAEKSKLNFNGFEFSVEMIRNIKVSNARFEEVPIKVIYTKDTLSKGQNLLTGIKMLRKILWMSRW